MVYKLAKPRVTSILNRLFDNVLSSKIEHELDLNLHDISNYMICICIITLFYLITLNRNSEERTFSLFPNISRIDADRSLLNLLKYFINYGFYKFGIEVILMMMLILICTKIDIISIIYVPIFIIFVFKKRQSLEVVCKLAANLIIFLIILQISIIKICEFSQLSELNIDGKFKKYFIIVMKNLHITPSNLIYDYVLLILLSCQSAVFENYKKIDFSQNPFKMGGENDSTIPPKKIGIDYIYKHYIYTFSKKWNSPMDLLKRYVFKVHYWNTILMIFFVGTTNIDIFSICYIICSFIFLWQGSEFYLKSFDKIFSQWNWLLSYNVIAISLKIIIKILGCTGEKMIPRDYCFLLSLFDFPCSSETNEIDDKIFCHEHYKDDPFFWDIVAFFLIISQRRIFHSYYFYSIKKEALISNMMTSRGAKLSEELRIQEVNKNIKEEKNYLEKLRIKMDKIRKVAAFRTLKGNNISHEIAVRNGDIFMFADDFNDEEQGNIVIEPVKRKSTVLISSSSFSQQVSETFFDIENISSNIPKEDVENRPKESAKIKFLKFFQYFFRKLHKHSRNHTYIIKLLNEEKSFLEEKLTCEEEQE